MSEELKSCPFCGSAAELNIDDMSVYCWSCDGQVTNYKSSKLGLIASWNRRDNKELIAEQAKNLKFATTISRLQKKIDRLELNESSRNQFGDKK